MAYADSSADQSLGQRTHGGQLPPVFLHGPGFTGTPPAGALSVASPTRYMEIAGRIMVAGQDDHAVVHRLQDRITLTRATTTGQPIPGPVAASPQRALIDEAHPDDEDLLFLHLLGNVLKDWIVSDDHTALVDSFERIVKGVGSLRWT